MGQSLHPHTSALIERCRGIRLSLSSKQALCSFQSACPACWRKQQLLLIL